MRNTNTVCSFCRKSYREVGPLVEGPGSVYICAECVELCRSIIDQEKRRRVGSSGFFPHLLAQDEIEERLGGYVSGKEEVSKPLAAAVYRHQEPLRQDPSKTEPAQQGNVNILLVGPSRSSELFLARTVAHILGVPFAQGKADALEQADRDPRNEQDPLWKLLEAGEFHLEAAQHGVLFIDGIDRPGLSATLLDLLDRSAPRFFPGGLRLDTRSLLIVCGGRFVGLDDVRLRRGRHPEQPITAEDLIAFGMAPELVHRLPVIIRTDPLAEEMLERIVLGTDLAVFS